MTEQYTKYWELYLKQKEGIGSTDEGEELKAWKNNHPAAFHEFDEMYHASKADVHTPDFDPGERWEELQSMMKIDSEAPGARTIRLFPWIARVAAAVILLIGFTFLFYQYQDLSTDGLNLQTMVQTNASEQKVVALPDGSTVWLNRNSELLYPESFDGETRPIYLKGEAFFDVTPNKDKPFIIHSGISKTTVLGTSFNLRAYGKEDEVKLIVVTGKVAFTLAEEQEGVIVTPGDIAVLNNQTKSISRDKNMDENFLSWKTNHLAFDDSPISELITSLERHYAVQIDVENPETLSCRFTGDFQDTELENAIKIIARATGFTYELIEGQYIIQGTGCN